VVSELLEDVSLETIAEKDLMESTQGKERRGLIGITFRRFMKRQRRELGVS
jgi:hypothetical protein